MTDQHFIETRFEYLGKNLIKQIIESSDIKIFPANTTLMREGQYIKAIPIVLSGLVKVTTQVEDKELLLYYIKPEQSCVMSFSSYLKNETSKTIAISEEETKVLLMPVDKVAGWVSEYSSINKLFFQQYDLRYSELIQTINHLLYHKLDKRLLKYLTDKSSLTGKNPIKISHKEIATEIGTVREVVSRLIKKLEKQNLLKQHYESIEILTTK